MSNYIEPLHATDMQNVRKKYRGKKVLEAHKMEDGKLYVKLGKRKSSRWAGL